jgi:hypothetical protein
MRALKCAVALGIIAVAVVAARGARQQRASPHDSVSASIDGADLSITYGRPYMRGRAIFGALVPYGRVWCPGADEATTLSTSKPLTIGALRLDARQYTLWFLPDAERWQLIVSKETGQWHTQYRAANDLGRMPVEPQQIDTPVEQLTFSFKKNPAGGGAIVFRWAATEVVIPFAVESR